MATFSVNSLILMGAAVLLSGFMRGLTGFGFAIAATPLISLLVTPKTAVAIVILLQLAFGVIDARPAWRIAHRAPFRGLLVGVLVGTPIGMALLGALSVSAERLIVAAAAALSLVLVLRTKDQRLVRLSTNIPTIGLTSGVLNGLAAMPGPPVVAYFLTAPISAASARASLIVFFTITAVIGAVSGWALGLMTVQALIAAAICTPFLIIGNWAGSALFRRGDERLYRIVAIAVLASSAAAAAWRGLASAL